MDSIDIQHVARKYLEQSKNKQLLDPNQVIRECYPKALSLAQEKSPRGARLELAKWIHEEVLCRKGSLRTVNNWISPDGSIDCPDLAFPAFTHFYHRYRIQLRN